MFSFVPRCQGLWGSQKVNLDLRGNGERLVRRQFVTAVPRQGHHEALGQRPDRLRERLDHAGRVLSGQWH